MLELTFIYRAAFLFSPFPSFCLSFSPRPHTDQAPFLDSDLLWESVITPEQREKGSVSRTRKPRFCSAPGKFYQRQVQVVQRVNVKDSVCLGKNPPPPGLLQLCLPGPLLPSLLPGQKGLRESGPAPSTLNLQTRECSSRSQEPESLCCHLRKKKITKILNEKRGEW